METADCFTGRLQLVKHALHHVGAITTKPHQSELRYSTIRKNYNLFFTHLLHNHQQSPRGLNLLFWRVCQCHRSFVEAFATVRESMLSLCRHSTGDLRSVPNLAHTDLRSKATLLYTKKKKKTFYPCLLFTPQSTQKYFLIIAANVWYARKKYSNPHAKWFQVFFFFSFLRWQLFLLWKAFSIWQYLFYLRSGRL